MSFPIPGITSQGSNSSNSSLGNGSQWKGRAVTDITEKLQWRWEHAGEAEKGFYLIAAFCFILAIIAALVVGPMAAMLLSSFGSGSLYVGRCYSHKREEWQMPPYSKNVRGNEEAEKDWERKWEERNLAKNAYENARTWTRQKKELGGDVDRDKAYTAILKQKYKAAEQYFT